jgi:acyl-coenzyme A synthetase/AMP-(fatty) acid ligase
MGRLILKILILAMLALAIIGAVHYGSQSEISVASYDMKANVTELRINDSKILVGVSNDDYELNFGVLSVNMSVEKFIDFKNNEPKEVVLP